MLMTKDMLKLIDGSLRRRIPIKREYFSVSPRLEKKVAHSFRVYYVVLTLLLDLARPNTVNNLLKYYMVYITWSYFKN